MHGARALGLPVLKALLAGAMPHLATAGLQQRRRLQLCPPIPSYNAGVSQSYGIAMSSLMSWAAQWAKTLGPTIGSYPKSALNLPRIALLALDWPRPPPEFGFCPEFIMVT